MDETTCPNCGSWTFVEDLEGDPFGDVTCPLCRNRARNENKENDGSN